MTEFLHAAPLLTVAGALVFRRRDFSLVALAYTMSVIGDSLAALGAGSWTSVYAWLPVQVALVLVYLLDGRVLHLALAVLLCAGIASYAWTFPGPEIVVTMFAMVVVVFFARGPLAYSLWAYFGLGGIAYLWMVVNVGAPDSIAFLGGWWAYQGCRLLAFAAFLGACGRDP